MWNQAGYNITNSVIMHVECVGGIIPKNVAYITSFLVVSFVRYNCFNIESVRGSWVTFLYFSFSSVNNSESSNFRVSKMCARNACRAKSCPFLASTIFTLHNVSS